MYPPVKRLLALCLLLASTAAVAGNMGPTSRATIAISIVIPPHVVAAQAGALNDAAKSGAPDRLCVETNGLRHYHLTLVGGTSAIDDGQILSLLPGAGCQLPSGAVAEQGATYFAPAATRREALMLLVVPD